MQRHGFDQARKSLHHLGDEPVAVADLHAQHAIHDGRRYAEVRFHPGSQRDRVRRFEQHHVPSDARPQSRRGSLHHDAPLVQQHQAVAPVGLVQNMGRQQYGNALAVAQFLNVLPEFAARAGVEPGGRLVHQQHLGGVQQAFGYLYAAAQPAGKRAHQVVTALVDPQPAHDVRHARAQRRARHTVQVALRAQVFRHR